MTDRTTKSELLQGWRFRLLVLSVLITAIGYLGISLFGGWDNVLSAVAEIGAPIVIVSLLLSLVNYYLRFVRWHSYLSYLGYSLAQKKHLQIYLSGFALTATPGKAGEALRSVLLEPLGVRYTDSLAALLSERLSDIIAVLLLSSLVFFLFADYYFVGLFFAGACLILLLLLQRAPQDWVLSRATKSSGRLSLGLTKFVGILSQTRTCNPPHLIVSGLALGLLAWSAEGFAFWLMLEQVDADVSLALAISIYCLSMLAGAASFMPGGVGGAEAAMAAMLAILGVPLHVAIAVTLAIRVATLWFAVFIGLLLLFPLMKSHHSQDQSDA